MNDPVWTDGWMWGALAGAFFTTACWILSKLCEADTVLLSAQSGQPEKLADGNFYYFLTEAEYNLYLRLKGDFHHVAQRED